MKRVRLKERKKHKKRLNVLLVDFSNLLYRATFANKTLTHQGIFTGGVYGFLRIISSLVDKYEVDQLVICKDTKPYFRAEVFPKYKTDRKTLEDEDDIRRIKQTIRLVGELVAMLHMLIAEEPGWEADDIIGTYCIKRWRFYKRILISSNDSDFFQFFSKERSNIFLCAKKGLYGYAQFKRDFPDIKTWQWPRIVALKGSHNGVPGIKGVGDKTAIKIVLSGTSNKELEAKYGAQAKDLKQRIALATYPFPAIEPGPAIPRARPIELDEGELVRWLNNLGIRYVSQFRTSLERLART